MKIEILDCTLRDGGYVNDWNFGNKVITDISQKVSDSSIEFIECGFLSQTKITDENKSIFRTIEIAEEYFKNCKYNLALMINCGEYDAENIPDYKNGHISTIRIAFHKHQMLQAQKLCVALQKKGYNVFFQPMVTMSYSDSELLSLIEWANQYKPNAFYIVDSFGTMRKNDVLRMFYLIDNNLNAQIKIGFHSHNNLQLSFSNAQELMSISSRRSIIIDTSVFGMGRGAGNLCTELLVRYINENIENKYDLIPILEAMDECIIPIYSKHQWGYSAPYYLAAINNCHPNYATYLMNLQTLCVKDINSIIKSIPDSERQFYNKEIINKLYIQYQQNIVDDSSVLKELSVLCKKRNIVILAPGRSILRYKDRITKYIEKKDAFVFAINHIPKYHKYDRIFMSNLKRFKNLDDAISQIAEKIVFTSNITTDKSVSVVNYSNYLNDDELIFDNSGLMFINLLKKLDVDSISLAGYDGFDYSATNNYYDENMINNVLYEEQKKTNSAIINYFRKIKRSMKIEFITPTIYDKEDNNE